MQIIITAGLCILILFAVLYMAARMQTKRTANQRAETPGDRRPTEEAYIFLTEKKAIWAGMLSDVLSQNQITFITKNVLGAGLTIKIGHTAEIVKFYVHRDCFEKAQELEHELFSGQENDAGQGGTDDDEL